MHSNEEEKPPTETTAGKSEVSDKSKFVVARLPQGYDTEINIRLIPGHDFQINLKTPGCQPRQGATRRDAVPVTLPPPLVIKLQENNMRVIEWLAKDKDNSRLFMERPVEALVKAGVELTRSEQKAINRTHGAVSEASVVAPGVRVKKLSVSVDPKARISKEGSTTKKKKESDEDCNCKPNGKE